MSELIMPEQPKRVTCLNVSKSQAMKIKMGQTVKLGVSGRVKGIREAYTQVGPNTEERFDIDIENPEITGLEDNRADMDLKQLSESQ